MGGEPNKRDNEVEILLVAAHGQDHADVTEAEKNTKPDQPANRFVRVVKQAGLVNQQGDQGSEQQAERGGGKRPERKPFHHLVHGDQESAKTESSERPPKAAIDQFRPHLTDGVAGNGGHAEK